MANHRYTHELCPQCDSEVKLDNKFEVQQCPSCKCPILPCGVCTHGSDDQHSKPCACDSCPLDNKLKDVWIEKLMNSVYKDDHDKYRDSDIRFLRTKTTLELSFMYQDWLNAQ